MPGVYEFYVDRIKSCTMYGFKAGEELLCMILRCMAYDEFLTEDNRNSIINLAEQAHIKLMEENYNAGWNQ